MEGWIYRHNRNVFLFSSHWKKGYWVLVAPSLVQLNKGEEEESCSIQEFQNETKDHLVSEVNIRNIRKIIKKEEDCFIIELVGGKELLLKVQDKNFRDAWFDKLNEILLLSNKSIDTEQEILKKDSREGKTQKGKHISRHLSFKKLLKSQTHQKTDEEDLNDSGSSSPKITIRTKHGSKEDVLQMMEQGVMFMGKARNFALSTSKELIDSTKKKGGVLFRPIREGETTEKRRAPVVPSNNRINEVIIDQSLFIKSPEQNEFLLKIVVNEFPNFFGAQLLQEISPQQIVDLMYSMQISKDSNIVVQGEPADKMFVISKGVVGVYSQDFEDRPPEFETEKKEGELFGVLAFLYNQPAPFTIKTHTECSLWAIQSRKFHELSTNETKKRVAKKVRLLQNVPLIKDNVDLVTIAQLADSMQYRDFEVGETLIRYGDILTQVYLVSEGNIRMIDGNGVVVGKLQEYDIFGEWALLNFESKSDFSLVATSSVKVLVLDGKEVEELIGPLRQIILQHWIEINKISNSSDIQQTKSVFEHQQEIGVDGQLLLTEEEENGMERVPIGDSSAWHSEKSLASRSSRHLALLRASNSLKFSQHSLQTSNSVKFSERSLRRASNSVKFSDRSLLESEKSNNLDNNNSVVSSSSQQVQMIHGHIPTTTPTLEISKADEEALLAQVTIALKHRETFLRETRSDSSKRLDANNGRASFLPSIITEEEDSEVKDHKESKTEEDRPQELKEEKSTKKEDEDTEHGYESEDIFISEQGPVDGAENLDKSFERLPVSRPEMILSKLKLCGLLGRGSFGRVHLAVNQTNYQDAFALKVLTRHYIVTNGWEHMVENERDAMVELSYGQSSPFLLQLVNSFTDSKNIYLLLELCEGGDLYNLMISTKDRNLTESATKFYIANVIYGLEAMHAKEIVYRDLKPENLMITRTGYVKLADFGLAKKTLRTFTVCGTPEYMAPETLLSHGHGMAVDWWAVGCVLHELICGVTPFAGLESIEVYEKILHHSDSPQDLSFHTKEHLFSSNAKDLIRQFLHPNKNKRLGMKYPGVEGVKLHEFYEGFVWEDILTQTAIPPVLPEISDMETMIKLTESRPYDPKLLHAPDDNSGWTLSF